MRKKSDKYFVRKSILVLKCVQSWRGHPKEGNNKAKAPKIPLPNQSEIFEYFEYAPHELNHGITLRYNNNEEFALFTPKHSDYNHPDNSFECQFNGDSKIKEYLWDLSDQDVINTYISFIKVGKDEYVVMIIQADDINYAYKNVVNFVMDNKIVTLDIYECLNERGGQLLRDLTKLRDEARKKIQQSQSEQYQEIKLCSEFKNLYATYVSKFGDSVEYLTHTTKLTTKDRQFVYIPNIWFLLVVDMFDFYKELGLYKEYYRKIEEELALSDSDKRDEYATKLYEIYDDNRYSTNPPDWKDYKSEFIEIALRVFENEPQIAGADLTKYANMLWQFASNGYQSWIGKIATESDKSDKKKTRKVSRNDFRDSVVLALLDLVAADQGYVPDIMAAYETEQKHFQKYLNDKQLIITAESNQLRHISRKDQIYEKGGRNKVVYGTPGCGKSTHVDTLLSANTPSKNIIRTTFYQDYTYTDFVGQILPEVHADGAVSYCFNPGPFTQALELAFANPKEKIALVIEELNRGNAPSIFGDMFQLLDRSQSVNGREGEGRFAIRNRSIQEYLKTKGLELDDIWLPANLSIYATMNTSDQNVFTLDTAFKRRWDFEKLLNEFTGDNKKEPLAPVVINGMPNVTWQIFVESINYHIINCNDLFKSEDKLLGIYFISNKNTLNNREDFAYKVFEYLWDDVFRNNHEYLFNSNIKTLDSLVKTYVDDGENDRTCVFCKEFRDLLNRNIAASKKNFEAGNKEKEASSTPTQHDSE